MAAWTPLRLAGWVALAGGIFASESPTGASEASSPQDVGVLYFVTTPQDTGGPAAAQRAVDFVKKARGAVRLRTILLVEDFARVGKLTEASPFYRTIKELQRLGTLDIPLYDQEGFALAEKWQVRSVPAFILVVGGKGHKATGTGVNLKDLWECRR